MRRIPQPARRIERPAFGRSRWLRDRVGRVCCVGGSCGVVAGPGDFSSPRCISTIRWIRFPPDVILLAVRDLTEERGHTGAPRPRSRNATVPPGDHQDRDPPHRDRFTNAPDPRCAPSCSTTSRPSTAAPASKSASTIAPRPRSSLRPWQPELPRSVSVRSGQLQGAGRPPVNAADGHRISSRAIVRRDWTP